MLADLTASRKILAAFGAFIGVVVIGSAVLVWSIVNVSNESARIGTRLAPLVDAAMEIKLSATTANLMFDKVMLEDAEVSVDDVYALLDETRFYADAVLNGGANAEGEFLASDDPRVRDKMAVVLTELATFRQAVTDRHAILEGNQGVGSDADVAFDGLYDEILANIVAVSAAYPDTADLQQLAGEARHLISHGHLMVEEALGGDAGEDFAQAIATFADAGAALTRIRQIEPGAAAAVTALATQVAQFSALAQTRFDTTVAQAKANADVTVVFDAAFADFTRIADEAEGIIQDDMAAGIARVETSRTFALAVGAVTAAVLLATIAAAYVWLDRSLGQRLTQLSAVMNRLIGGDLDAVAPSWDSADEVGILRNSVDKLRGALLQQVKLEGLAAEEKTEADAQRRAAEAQRHEAVTAREAAEQERKDAHARAVSADRFAMAFGDVVARASEGKFDKRITTTFTEPNLAALVDGTNCLMAEVERGIAATVTAVAELANGNLTNRMDGTFVGDFAHLQNNVNQMIASLISLIGSISERGVNLAVSSAELRDTSDVLLNQAEQNAASLEETSAALEQLSSSIRQASTNVSEARNNAREARETAQASEKIANEAASSMDRIADASHEIRRVVAVIDDIAFQINLLALNAGVEAARAGDAGRGFSVVASEVRQLAQRAGEASRTIATVISQSDTAVSEGVSKVAHAKSSLEAISDNVLKIAQGVDEVTTSISAQSISIEEITRAVRHIDQSMQTQAAAFGEVTASSSLLASEAKHLQQTTARFKTETVSRGPAPGKQSVQASGLRAGMAAAAGGR